MPRKKVKVKAIRRRRTPKFSAEQVQEPGIAPLMPADLPHVTKINRMLAAIEGHWVTIRDLAQDQLNKLGNT